MASGLVNTTVQVGAAVGLAVLATLSVRREGDGGAYVGFLGDEREWRIREAYPGSTWERLAGIKGCYDPTNLFRLNQNIPPASEAKTTTEHKESSDGSKDEPVVEK